MMVHHWHDIHWFCYLIWYLVSFSQCISLVLYIFAIQHRLLADLMVIWIAWGFRQATTNLLPDQGNVFITNGVLVFTPLGLHVIPEASYQLNWWQKKIITVSMYVLGLTSLDLTSKVKFLIYMIHPVRKIPS